MFHLGLKLDTYPGALREVQVTFTGIQVTQRFTFTFAYWNLILDAK